MPSKYFSCIVPGCGNTSALNPHELFFQLPKTLNILNEWVRHMNHPDLLHKPESTRRHYKVCSRHFDDSCFQTYEKKKLNRRVVPTIFNLQSSRSPKTQTTAGPSVNLSDDKMATVRLQSPEINKRPVTPATQLGTVLQEVEVDNKPSIFTDTTAKESSKPVESIEDDPQTNSVKLVEEPEVTPVPTLSVSSSAHNKEEEEVLKTNNKQPRTDRDPFKKRTVWKPQCRVGTLESSMKRERNWNLAMNEISALRKRVNRLENQNGRLDRRLRSMKSLLRHYKNKHAR